MDTSTSITAPDSVFFRGQWHAATWLAEVVDESTGELIITATLAGAEREPVVTALRMDMALARGLRLQAGLPPQFQVEARRMRARMRYVADVLRSARRMLDTPTVDEVDGLLLHAIGQLRMADGKDGADGSGGECYDCRTTGQRLQALEAVVSEQAMQINGLTHDMTATNRLMHGIANRLDALESEQRIASQTLHASLNEIERRLAVEYGDSATRLDALETWQVETDDKLSIVDARAQNDAVAGAERLAALEAWQVAVAMDTAEDNSLFQIYDAVARRERAKGGA